MILTVLTVEHFSKTANFIPLHKVPSTKETTEIMLSHVFCLHGFPNDIVSDRRRNLSLVSGLSSAVSWEIQEIETALRYFSSRNPSSWSKPICIEYVYNTLSFSIRFY